LKHSIAIPPPKREGENGENPTFDFSTSYSGWVGSRQGIKKESLTTMNRHYWKRGNKESSRALLLPRMKNPWNGRGICHVEANVAIIKNNEEVFSAKVIISGHYVDSKLR